MRSLLQYRGYCIFVSLLVLLCANNSQQTPQEEGKNIYNFCAILRHI
jgi:hypothetical protein